MPACAWKVSGGSLAWSRDCSRSFAAEPAPPATAPLMNSTSGYLSARVATLADKYPDVEFINGAVAGGAGSAAKDLLQSRLQANDPPDTFQAHAGMELNDYIQAGQVQDISDLYTEFGLTDVFPQESWGKT